MRMTIEEVSVIYGYSVVSIQRNFKRTAQAIQRKLGLDLIKCQGPDGKVFY